MVMWKDILKTPRMLRLGMNVWPPFAAAGIRVEEVAADFTFVKVSLRRTFYNGNYVGTHFGGSLFAMTDPFFMLLLMQHLGDRYHVWDRSGHIDFVSPGRGRVVADIRITAEDVQAMRDGTSSGDKYERDFQATIRDENNRIVARVKKRVYARLKPAHRPEAAGPSE